MTRKPSFEVVPTTVATF